MAYKPPVVPLNPADLPRFLQTEFERIAQDLADNASAIFYRTNAITANSLSVNNAASANWKQLGNVLLVSTSTTQTFTGLQRRSRQLDAYREVVFFNIGTGVAVLKNQASESSASNRFALVQDYSLSQFGAVTLWRDPFAARWRGISIHGVQNAGAVSGGSVNVQTFDQTTGGNTQTWNKPSCTFVRVILVGGGGGGGSGSCAGVFGATASGGGGGGAGGGLSIADFLASDLASSVSVVFSNATTGGAGGAAATPGNTGSSGTVGSDVQFGAGSNYLLYAFGGGSGGGGTAAGGGSATGGRGWMQAGTSSGGGGGATAGSDANTETGTTVGQTTYATGGGGGGAGVSAGRATNAGGRGTGVGSTPFWGSGLGLAAGGSGGSGSGVAGGTGGTGLLIGFHQGLGGGGGGSAWGPSAVGGPGGLGGGYGSGGGGGGGCLNDGAHSGAGGNGGSAACIVLAW